MATDRWVHALDHVIATGRKEAELDKLRSEAAGLRFDTLVPDVTSGKSIEAAVTDVARLTDGHGLDVLVNNAGFGVLGPSSESPMPRCAASARRTCSAS